MSRPVTASVPHSLGKEEARRRIREGFATIQSGMSGGLMGMMGVVKFTERWEGDRLNFEGSTLGQKICGRLDVLADSVKIEVDLPEMLAAIAERITAGLSKGTQLLLGKK